MRAEPDMAEAVDLNFIARQLERVLAEVAMARADVAVLTAIMARRTEVAANAVLQELRARNSDLARW
jgi:hypothetical protein